MTTIWKWVSWLRDTVQAWLLDMILRSPLGPKALAVQTKHLTSCAREFVIRHPNGKVLLFLRGPGVRYSKTWHLSGTTVNAKKLKQSKGITPFQSVRQKYGLEEMMLGEPVFAGFVEVLEGFKPGECTYGEVWTELYDVPYISGDIPANAVWFSIDKLPTPMVEYHEALLLPRYRAYVAHLHGLRREA